MKETILTGTSGLKRYYYGLQNYPICETHKNIKREKILEVRPPCSIIRGLDGLMWFLIAMFSCREDRFIGVRNIED